MGYAYGDRRTAGNGIWLWLQGVRNHRKGTQGPNYIPQNLDINQKDKFVRDLLREFLNKQGVEVTAAKMYKHTRRYYSIVQKDFHQFVKFVTEKYAYENSNNHRV